MPPPKERAQAPDDIKRLTDYVQMGGGTPLEGRRLDSVEEILGKEVILQDFAVVPSRQYGGEFIVMQFTLKDELCTVACGGGVVVDSLKQMPKNYLPVKIKVIRIKSQSTGRMYLSIE